MKKVIIHIAAGVGPFQLEVFPDQPVMKGNKPSMKAGKPEMRKAERSVKGALHLCGNATKGITPDELEALKKARPDLVALKLRVLSEMSEVVQKQPEVVPAPEAIQTAEDAGGATSVVEDDKKGGRGKKGKR